jgi:hypothetical protein
LPAGIKLRRLHRWLGAGALAFLLWLSVSGVVLNHSTGLGLAERRVTAPWLLDWYGIDMPPIAASYAAGSARLTLVGEQLYIDSEPAFSGVTGLRGAVAAGGYIIAATPDDLLVFSGSFELLDRVRLESLLPAAVDALGRREDSGDVVLKTAAGTLSVDVASFDVNSRSVKDESVQWSKPLAPSPALQSAIAASYRGEGISLERLLYDLHSGRVLERAGILLMDAAGVLIIALSVSGLILWLKPRKR